MTLLQQFSAQLSATRHLALVSLRRLFFSRQTLICILLLALASLAVFAWGHRRLRSPAEFIEDILVTVYMSFLLPMFCLSFASAGIATDREEQTLVYLLTTPLPRPWIFAAKVCAALAISLAWTMGSLALLCLLAGSSGGEAFRAVWQAIFASTIAYVALFQLFSVLFRRATIVALGYALFLETLVGNMPGIVKRLTICFYARCLIFESSSDIGIAATGPFDPLLFRPIPASTAHLMLYAASGALLLVGMMVFMMREY
jgi:ABC-type transport system involved in multi-copper enzyme maturation permease subunit